MRGRRGRKKGERKKLVSKFQSDLEELAELRWKRKTQKEREKRTF